LAEEKEKPAVVEGRTARAAIIRVDPAVAEEALFRKLPQQVIEDEKTSAIIEKLEELKAGPENIAAIVHTAMRQNVGTLLGYIIPPESGASIVKDRVVQVATVLLEMLSEKVRRVEIEISQAIREGREFEVEEKVGELIQEHHAAIIAIREIMNRYLTLYYLNLPANLRPPLGQVKLGMEIVTQD